jgi:hypothetical protein
MRDLKFAIRALSSTPFVTAIAIVSLAGGPADDEVRNPSNAPTADLHG